MGDSQYEADSGPPFLVVMSAHRARTFVSPVACSPYALAQSGQTVTAMQDEHAVSREAFLARGWCHFHHDPQLAQWVADTRDAARAAVRAAENAEWLRCGGTWFVGVNALPNNERGAVRGGAAVAGQAVEFIREALGLAQLVWDRAQVSVVYPGYPQPMATESAAAYRYRRERDAAHLDGVLRQGPRKRRHLCEHHAFILGIPMVETSRDASPLTLWEGSHEITRRTLQTAFAGVPPEDWQAIDITELYQSLRRRIFAECRRVEIAARPGEAYLVHRLALHGIMPWPTTATAGPDGRMIVYFRPDVGSAEQWLSMP